MPRASAASTPVVYTNQQILDAATGKWGEVAHEVKPAEPIDVTVPDGSGTVITITPLTRRRRKALKTAQATYLMVGGQLAEAQRDGDANQSTISKVESVMEQAEVAYDDALFGDKRQAIYDLFDDLDEAYWDAMYQLVHDQLVNRVEIPEDICSKCGQKVETEGAEGKGESSST